MERLYITPNDRRVGEHDRWRVWHANRERTVAEIDVLPGCTMRTAKHVFNDGIERSCCAIDGNLHFNEDTHSLTISLKVGSEPPDLSSVPMDEGAFGGTLDEYSAGANRR